MTTNQKHKGRILSACLFSLLLSTFSEAQPVARTEEPTPATVITAANTRYNKAGQFKRFFFGNHYRREWATPVEIPVLDMTVYAGGLTPIKSGGGHQTKSLRLAGANGNEYVLRSVNKDPSQAIAEELRGTFAEAVVQDQISSSNPYAPLVVASLSEAAHLMHSTPELVYVPATDALGEFKESFGESLCLIELRPTGKETNDPSFGFARTIVNSEKLLEKIFSNADHNVNEKAFVKARLFDMLIGDWDRHEDQWLWAAVRSGEKTVYYPIARDRDQAFSRMDGLIPQMATKKWAIRKVQGFDSKIEDVYGLNANGAFLDRNFTTRLTLKDWMEAAEELQEQISDSAIAEAFREMPAPVYAISGDRTVAHLKKRRDDLPKYAAQYYYFLSREVTLTGTQRSELFSIRRDNTDSTTVIIYKNTSGDLQDRVTFCRTFSRKETREIRIYGLGGDDQFTVRGTTNEGIRVRLIGGEGQDSYCDYSSVKKGGHQTWIYDVPGNASTCRTGPESKLVLSNDTLKNVYNRKSFRFDWFAPTLNPGFNPDDGFFMGAGFNYKKQSFGVSPFAAQHIFGFNHAFGTGASAVWYRGYFKEFAGKADLQIEAKYNSPAYAKNFYGAGNETEYDKTADADYYRLRMSQATLSTSLHRNIGKYHHVWMGSALKYYHVDSTSGRFVTTPGAKMDSASFVSKKYGQTFAGYEWNTLDNAVYPTQGNRFHVNATYSRQLGDSKKDFIQLNGEWASYHTLGRFTLATRLGAATNLGNDYEFFQANSMGGLDNLRGYHKDRFTGKTSVYQNSELRFRAGHFNAYFTRGSWGLLAFSDHGRVWVPEETSHTWQSSYGGGIWFLPFEKMSLTATYGVSKEDQLVNVKAGFLF